MKKTAIFIFSLVFILFLTSYTTQVFALTNSVHCESSSTNGSDANCNVQSNTSTNYSNTPVIQSNSHSKVTITCDGKTYTYESNGENIDANPCEGSSVKINNNGSTTTSITPPNPTEIKEQIERKIEEEKEKVKATITAVPKPTSIPKFSFDLGAWIRALILSFFN